MTARELVCLANSAKLSGYCFAGIDLATGEWIRPIGSGEHGAITRREQIMDNGRTPQLLDVVSVRLTTRDPIPGQPENWRMASEPWRYVSTLGNGEARSLLTNLTTTEPIFGSPGKRVEPTAVAAGLVTSSLAIAAPATVTWRYDGPRNLYAEFHHAGTSLSLKVTDPEFARAFRGDEPGTYTFENDDRMTTYLTVSLPEEWKGAHWKLVAGVIRL
jgi:hypothetical protein